MFFYFSPSWDPTPYISASLTASELIFINVKKKTIIYFIRVSFFFLNVSMRYKHSATFILEQK